MSKRTPVNAIITDEKQLEKLTTFTSLAPPDLNDCTTESKFLLDWKPNQLFQFSNPEVQVFYEKSGLVHMITERSLELFAQGRKPSECEIDPKPMHGQGFIYNGRLAKNEDDQLVVVYNLVPGVNKGDGLPRSNNEGKPFSYKGKKFPYVEGGPLGSNTGIMHGWAKQIVLTAAESKSAKQLYEWDKLNMSGGVWVGEDKSIGMIRNKSASQNFQTFRYNPLFLLCRCVCSDEVVSNHPDSVTWYKRCIPLKIFLGTKAFFNDILPVKSSQIRGINENTQHQNEFEMAAAMEMWENMDELERTEMLEARVIYFAKQINRLTDQKFFKDYELTVIGDEEILKQIDFDYLDENILYVYHDSSVLSYRFKESEEEFNGKINLSEINHPILGYFKEELINAYLPQMLEIIKEKHFQKSKKFFQVETLLFHCEKQNIKLNVNCLEGDEKHTAIMYCVFNKKYHSLLKLLKFGADPFIINTLGKQAIDYAEPEVQPALRKLFTNLLKTKYPAVSEEKNGNTLLHEILSAEPINFDHAYFILNSVSDSKSLLVENNQGWFPLDCLIQNKSLKAEDLDLLMMGIKAGGQLRTQGTSNPRLKPLVMEEVQKQEYSSLSVLTNEDLLFTDEHGRTFLHHAAYRGHVQAIRFLIERTGTKLLDSQDENGNTPLHMTVASHSQKLDAVVALLEAGADRDISNKSGDTAVDLVQPHTAIMRLLKASKPKNPEPSSAGMFSSSSSSTTVYSDGSISYGCV